MSTFVPADVEKNMRQFLHNIQRTAHLYGEIVNVCAIERKHIEAGEMQPLLHLLNEKQRVIARITPLEAAIAEQKGTWLAYREHILPSLRSDITEALKDFGVLLEQLVILQKENEERMIVVERQKAEAITKLRAAKKIHHAYNSYTDDNPHATYMDKKK